MIPKLEERRAIKAASLAFTEAHRIAREKYVPQVKAAADALRQAQQELERVRCLANEEPEIGKAERQLTDARAALAGELAVHPEYDTYLECALTGLPILIGDEVVGNLRDDGICILAAFVQKSECVSVSTITLDEGEDDDEEGEAVPA